MITSKCRHHPTQRSVSVLLRFLSGKTCHSMKVKSWNFLMLRGNHGLSTVWEEEGRKWICTLIQYKKILFKYTVYLWWIFSFLICVSIWESAYMLCHILILLVTPSAKGGSCMRVMLVRCFSSNWHQQGSYTPVFFIAITLMDYLLLTYVKRLFQKEAFFFYMYNSASCTGCIPYVTK